MDTVYDLLQDEDCARTLIADHVGGPGDPGYAWMSRDHDRSTLQGMLRGTMLIAKAAHDLLREDVQQALLEGHHWHEIALALDIPVETARLAYGGEVDAA